MSLLVAGLSIDRMLGADDLAMDKRADEDLALGRRVSASFARPATVSPRTRRARPGAGSGDGFDAGIARVFQGSQAHPVSGRQSQAPGEPGR
jgi:hypothetical protein